MPEQHNQVQPIPPQRKVFLPMDGLPAPFQMGISLLIDVHMVEDRLTRISRDERMRRRAIGPQIRIIEDCCEHTFRSIVNQIVDIKQSILTIRKRSLEVIRVTGDRIEQARLLSAQEIDLFALKFFESVGAEIFDPRTLAVILTHGQINMGAKGIMITEIENPSSLALRLVLVSLHALYLFSQPVDTIDELLPGRIEYRLRSAYLTYIGTLYSLCEHEFLSAVPSNIRVLSRCVAEYLETKQDTLGYIY